MRPLCLTAAVIALFAPAAPAQVAPSYRLTELPGIGPNVLFSATLNDLGQVPTGLLVSSGSPPIYHVARTSPAGQPYSITDLGQLPGAMESIGYAINESGQVAGYSGVSDASASIVRSTPNGQPPGLTDFGQFGSTSRAYGINDAGEMTGSARVSNNDRAFRSSPNGAPPALNPLGTLGGFRSIGYDINASGQVAGESTNALEQLRAFRSTPSSQAVAFTDLGVLPGGLSSTARAVNDAGQVVGWTTYAGSVHHAFRSSPNGQPVALTDLHPIGYASTQARDINALGVVVGLSLPGTAIRAFAFSDASGFVDLTSRLDPGTGAGWIVTDAVSVSDNGYILAIGRLNNGADRTVLLTPVPEPSALALAGFAAAAGAAAWRRRRQALR